MPLPHTVVSGTINEGGSVITTGVFVVCTNSGSDYHGSSATDLLLSGGSLAAVQAGGVLQGGLVDGGYPFVTLGDSVTLIPSAVDMGAGGLASGIAFADDTTLDVFGSATGNVLTGSAIAGIQSGGFDSGTTLSAGTLQIVESGGTASGVITSSGGEQEFNFTNTNAGGAVSGGGTVNGSNLLAGGALYLPDFPYHSGGTSASFDSGTGTLTVTNGSDTDTLTLAGNYTNETFVVTDDTASTGGLSVSTQVACYCPGTLILTTRGEVLVEMLRISSPRSACSSTQIRVESDVPLDKSSLLSS